MMKPILQNGYSYEVDNISQQEWSVILGGFDDASVYQTWEYGVTHWGKKNISRLILKKDEDIVAITQLRTFKLPVLKSGIAYIRWGPVWKLKNRAHDFEVLKNMLKSLFSEYVLKRNCILKIFPRIMKEDELANKIKDLFIGESFRFFSDPHCTMLFPLFHPISLLRSGLDRRWRQKLVKSEKNNLKFKIGTENGLFNIGQSIHQKMLRRKKFDPMIEINKYIAMQCILPEYLKLKISICYDKAVPLSFITWSEIGNTAVVLFAGTTDKALKSYASFLTWWKLIEHLKERKCQWIDLGGINQQRNPGSYRFKAGICKKLGKEVTFLGQFEAGNNFTGNLMLFSAKLLKLSHEKLKLFLETKTKIKCC